MLDVEPVLVGALSVHSPSVLADPTGSRRPRLSLALERLARIG
jgi:hypothetical protein